LPLQALRRLLGKPASTGSGQAGAYSGAPSGFIRLVQACFSPDEKQLWSWWAVPAAVRDAREAPIDVILSSGPPHTAHVIARTLSRRLGVPYVMDLRDQWVGNYFFKPLTPLNAWLTRRAEARCARDAAAIVTTAPTVTREIAERYPGVRAETIYNGYDPEDLPSPLPAVPSAGPLRLTHAGTFSGRRTPRWFLRGMAAAEAADPSLVGRMEADFVGLGDEVEAMAAEEGVRSPVRGLGYLPHAESVARLASSPATLIILSEGPESRVTVPGKVFEYLAVRRPLLCLAGDGDVADLLADVPGTRTVAPEDPAAIARALAEMAAAWEAGTLLGPPACGAEPYARPVQVGH
jgi:glycosyltransferase involved in cell wall biosynthesis